MSGVWDWWVGLTFGHGLGGLVAGGLTVAAAALAVLAALTAVMWLVAAFKTGFQQGWGQSGDPQNPV